MSKLWRLALLQELYEVGNVLLEFTRICSVTCLPGC